MKCSEAPNPYIPISFEAMHNEIVENHQLDVCVLLSQDFTSAPRQISRRADAAGAAEPLAPSGCLGTLQWLQLWRIVHTENRLPLRHKSGTSKRYLPLRPDFHPGNLRSTRRVKERTDFTRVVLRPPQACPGNPPPLSCTIMIISKV